MEYTINYFEEGKEKEKVVNIRFFSNYNRERYNEIQSAAFEAKADWDRMSDINSLIEAKTSLLYKGEVDKGKTKEEIQQLKDEYQSCLLNIKKFEKVGLLKDRFNLIKNVLEDNGVEDKELLRFEFWDKQVDPKITMKFLTEVAIEDIKDVKKNWTM